MGGGVAAATQLDRLLIYYVSMAPDAWVKDDPGCILRAHMS